MPLSMCWLSQSHEPANLHKVRLCSSCSVKIQQNYKETNRKVSRDGGENHTKTRTLASI